MARTFQRITFLTAFICALLMVFITDEKSKTNIIYVGLGAFATSVFLGFIED